MNDNLNVSPEVSDILKISADILREFARYANDYYKEHIDDKQLQVIDNDYTSYEHLFREVLAALLGIHIDRHLRVYTLSFVKPYVTYLKTWLRGIDISGSNGYSYCRKWRAYVIEATNRMIDTTILHTMFNIKEGMNNECTKD